MTLCHACLAIEVHRLGASGHAFLRITDTQRIKASKTAAVTVSTFTCRTCGASWTYREGKNVPNPGWSLDQ
ncbi:hypothetical protein [Ralstonia flaminis]|jgi:hypothetical protein|uniref:Uncharacterized protein n=1 Tax=Ralstonia flaminis TaxID=3058597 RepID=A0ABM9K3A9_9RALS|nr:hypothetical protein [Ralstonia sp. LMG 18101]CAJ0813705.1 hypothetical protein LMG18101_02004 [Ralstonia sp. LMG 18101]